MSYPQYPQAIGYMGGDIRFFYEKRPDPVRDFEAGVERSIHHRLKEVRVSTAGLVESKLQSRRIFGYEGPRADGTTYSTERSRLAWTQLFGKDCTNVNVLPTQPSCSALPKQEFFYTDPKDTLGAGGPQYADDGDFPYLTTEYRPVRFADLDGDGLVDKLEAGFCTYCDPPAVTINGGSPAENAAWTAALTALRWRRPKLRATQVLVNEPDPLGYTRIGICHASIGWDEDLPFNNLGLKFWRGVSREFYKPDGETWGPEIGETIDTFIYPEAWFHAVDLDGDARAELVMSVRLTDVAVTVDCNGTPIPKPSWRG